MGGHGEHGSRRLGRLRRCAQAMTESGRRGPGRGAALGLGAVSFAIPIGSGT